MTRDVRYRVDVLRNGAPITQLQWADGDAPQIMWDRAANIHGALRGSFRPNDLAKLESDELRPWMSVDGVETSLGIYQATTASKKGSAGSMRIEIEAYDRCWRVYTQKTETLLHLSAGASYLTEIRKLLTTCGVTLVIATPNDAVLATDREDWDIGTSYLTIVNALLSEINYESLWFDADGVCRLEPYQGPSAAIIDWRYGTTDLFLPEKHLGQNWSDETDIFDAPNVFVVTCNNPDLDAAMVATAVNDNPASKKSTFKRGMRITSVERVDNIASQEELQAYANKRRNESLLAARAITFYTLNEPGHGVGDILALTHDDLGGIYLETGWSITMQAGSLMTHSAKRTVIA